MLIGLHDAEKDYIPWRREKTFPNLALMKISAYHKKLGDEIVWWKRSAWFDKIKYDKVYSSKVFSFTEENTYLPKDTIKGGSGYNLFNSLPDEIDNQYPDYSLYPDIDYAIEFLTRGCVNNCDFCVVPKKGGKIYPYSIVENIVRQDTDKLVFLDNNVLAHQHGLNELEKLANSNYRVDFNQGMDITLVTPELIEVFKRIKWISYLRFSCDSKNKIKYFEKLIDYFHKYELGSKIFIYLLVRNDINDAEYRVRELFKINKHFHLYAQPERNIGVEVTKEMKEFANRYIYGRLYYNETWEEYCYRHRYKKLKGLKNE